VHASQVVLPASRPWTKRYSFFSLPLCCGLLMRKCSILSHFRSALGSSLLPHFQLLPTPRQYPITCFMRNLFILVSVMANPIFKFFSSLSLSRLFGIAFALFPNFSGVCTTISVNPLEATLPLLRSFMPHPRGSFSTLLPRFGTLFLHPDHTFSFDT
jgi:hypothetical protein